MKGHLTYTACFSDVESSTRTAYNATRLNKPGGFHWTVYGNYTVACAGACACDCAEPSCVGANYSHWFTKAFEIYAF
jgi:hypothetical protein